MEGTPSLDATAEVEHVAFAYIRQKVAGDGPKSISKFQIVIEIEHGKKQFWRAFMTGMQRLSRNHGSVSSLWASIGVPSKGDYRDLLRCKNLMTPLLFLAQADLQRVF